MAAKTSWNFIQEVGLNIDPKMREKKLLQFRSNLSKMAGLLNSTFRY